MSAAFFTQSLILKKSWECMPIWLHHSANKFFIEIRLRTEKKSKEKNSNNPPWSFKFLISFFPDLMTILSNSFHFLGVTHTLSYCDECCLIPLTLSYAMFLITCYTTDTRSTAFIERVKFFQITFYLHSTGFKHTFCFENCDIKSQFFMDNKVIIQTEQYQAKLLCSLELYIYGGVHKHELHLANLFTWSCRTGMEEDLHMY